MIKKKIFWTRINYLVIKLSQKENTNTFKKKSIIKQTDGRKKIKIIKNIKIKITKANLKTKLTIQKKLKNLTKDMTLNSLNSNG